MSCPEDYKKCENYVINAPLYRKCIKDSSIGECHVERKRASEVYNRKMKYEFNY